MNGHEIVPIPRMARAFQGRTAGVVTRVVAGLIDGAAVALMVVTGYLGLAGIRFLLEPRAFRFPDPSVWLGLVTGAVGLTIYLTVAWGGGGRTCGNCLMGLRVVTARGGRVGWARAALRAGAYVAFPAGLLWIAVDRRSRSMQDVALCTAVVYDWRPSPGSRL